MRSSHYVLRKGFDDAHPRAYESPEAKENHQERIKDTKSSIKKAKQRVEEHELYQCVICIIAKTFN